MKKLLLLLAILLVCSCKTASVQVRTLADIADIQSELKVPEGFKKIVASEQFKEIPALVEEYKSEQTPYVMTYIRATRENMVKIMAHYNLELDPKEPTQTFSLLRARTPDKGKSTEAWLSRFQIGPYENWSRDGNEYYEGASWAIIVSKMYKLAGDYTGKNFEKLNALTLENGKTLQEDFGKDWEDIFRWILVFER